MFQNDILDVAIGLIFAWFIMSLVISVVNDSITLLFRIRAKNLWLGIDRLLNPATGKYARHFWDAVIFLPFSKWNTKGLDVRPKATTGSADKASDANVVGAIATANFKAGRANKDPDTMVRRQQTQKVYNAIAPMVTDVAIAGRTSKLTIISGPVFAEGIAALAQRVHPADLQSAASDLGWNQHQKDALSSALQRISPNASYDLDTTMALALGVAVTDDQKHQLYGAAKDTFTARDVLDLFSGNDDLQRALRKALELSGADQKSAAIRATLQTWFEREMEQLSALYRRQNRKILTILALPVVLVFQANTLGLISDLRGDAALREAVTSQVVAVAGAESVAGTVDTYCPAAAAGGGEPLEAASNKLQCARDIIRDATRFEMLPNLERIEAYDGADGLSFADAWHYEFTDWGAAGRAITLLALMFGAQFWFDVLRRLVGIRASIGGTSGSSAG